MALLPRNPWIVFLLGVLFAQFVLPFVVGLFASARGAVATKNGK